MPFLRRFGFLIAALALAACGSEPAAPQQTAVETIAIHTVRPERIDIAEPVLGTGTIAPARVTDIGPLVDGIIEEVMVKVGDRVAQGQPLFRTRQDEYRLTVQELEGRVALARAENKAAQAQLTRAAQLKKDGVVPQGRLDDIRARAESAAAQLQIAEAQLARAQQAVEDTIVRAPYAGVIVRQDVYEGRFMATRMPGGMGGGSGGGGVVQIMQIDRVAAIVQVAEPNLTRLAIGLPATVTVDGLDRAFEATVDVINDRVDDRTRGIEVRLAIDNADLTLKPGLFARAEIRPAPRPATVLARAAVLGTANARFVYAVIDGKAVRRDIRTRELDAERIEIVDGLAASEAVVSGPNLRRVYDGAPVAVQDAVASVSAAAR